MYEHLYRLGFVANLTHPHIHTATATSASYCLVFVFPMCALSLQVIDEFRSVFSGLFVCLEI